MKDNILKILKYFLIVLSVVLVILFLLGLVFLMNWPWWVSIFLVLGAIGIFIGCLFLRKLLLRRKEQQFVQDVIEADNSRMSTLADSERSQHKELQAKWKEAVDTLRKSHLRKQGNPLYVLPWYLVMGESGSGKSTAISSARLNSPFAEVHHVSGVSGTRNCDWWFFDEAIILDTAGRYAMPVDSGRDNDEWQKFLSQLLKYRKKEPIHGLIMTVAADKILGGSPEILQKDGLQLRRRIDELMRVLGIKFPVYVLVTKCDLIQGMTQFSEQLSESALKQPMGYVNQDVSKDVSGFINIAVSTLLERLKKLRLLMLNKQEKVIAGSDILLFPDEFANLKSGLQTFITAAFQESRYQDTPFLRGVFFSSGKQEGTPFSHFLNSLGLVSDRDVLPGTSKGLFLHDFFDKVLPRDRKLFAPTTRVKEWQSLTKNLGLTSWIIVWIALSGLLSYSFVKNMATIRTASGVIAKAPELRGDFVSDISTMDQYRQMIMSVELQNKNWWIPRFWLNECIKVEDGLKMKYCKQFQDRFLVSFDKNMNEVIAGFSTATPDDLMGQYIVHLARRINLLKARLEGGGMGTLSAKPLPSYVLSSVPNPDEVENVKKFGKQYLNYLVWRVDSNDLSREISVLQGMLQRCLTIKGANLHWLPDWINRQGVAPPLTLQTFWGGTRAAKDEIVIPPAFTRKGKEIATVFQGELKSAISNSDLVDRESESFNNWYRGNCFNTWAQFAYVFPRGEERLNGAKEWRVVAETMATDQGPYFAFFSKVASELEAFGNPGALPPVLQQIVKYQVYKTAGPVAGVAGKAVDEGKKMAEKVNSLIGRQSNTVAAVPGESQTAAAKAVQEYQGALAAITPVAKSKTQAYQLALQVFSEDPVASKSPFYVAADASQRLNGSITNGKADDSFIRLQSGPLAFLWNFSRMETACVIQSQWEEKVLKEAQGASDPQVLQYLVGQDGPVWKFVNGSLAPFHGWSPQKGYYSKVALGGGITFEPAFFTFLAKGTKAKIMASKPPSAPKQNNGFTIKGLPTDANADAKIKPQSTRLELQCSTGPQIIENMNYPVSKTFNWNQEVCGDVTFQIDIGELVLSKQYPGAQGFPAFVKDFQGGRHTFYPQDFPREKAALERMGVRFIRANYQFSGILDSVGQNGGTAPGAMTDQIPRVITKCWD
ncbi:MAG: type VI secretion protein IcmF/TssM N-terminal domain-containing protein [Desulfuromonadaceae bacterium]